MANEVLSATAADFYVYVHLRGDNSAPFYVGKGRGKRAYTKRYQNTLWMRIANKHGFEPLKVFEGLPEACAFSLERAMIATLRKSGIALANATDGGEGPAGRTYSASTLEKMRAAKLGKSLTAEHVASIKAALSGRSLSCQHKEALRGREFSEAHRRKLSKSATGRKMSPDAVARMAATKVGKRASAETRRKMSISRTGENNPFHARELYEFHHPEHGTRRCTQLALRQEFNLPHSNLSHLVKGKRNSVHGWKIVSPGG